MSSSSTALLSNGAAAASLKISKATLISHSSQGLASLTPEDLPHIRKRKWPRKEAKLPQTRQRTNRLLSCPKEGFVCDPSCTPLHLPRLPIDVKNLLGEVLYKIIGQTLRTSNVPHHRLEDFLHQKGLVLINWPYQIPAFFAKGTAAFTPDESILLLKACLHPNPASRVQLISRHHFPSDRHPGYISYVSSYHQNPRRREIVDEDHNIKVKISPEPLVVHYQPGRCPCHLSTCKPIDFSPFIDFQIEDEGNIDTIIGITPLSPTIKRPRKDSDSA
ncbi:hypothetical protein SISNIDRAFT_459901, partial [Sistotremastrum niveocremeum HHB9708]